MSFQLTARDQRLEVRVVAPGGECRVETTIPSDIASCLSSELDPSTISSSTLKSVGQRLYQCLMTGDAARLAFEVLQDGRQWKQPVHLELRFDADQTSLAQYPWEMIADENARFLVRAGLANLTRYITYPQPLSVLDAVSGNSPLLRVISQPVTLPSLAAVDLALERIETLPHATFQELEKKLLIERLKLWGLHFDGHGTLAQQCRQCGGLHSLGAQRCMCGAPLSEARRVGVLAFERNGDVDWRTTEELAEVIYNSPISLAVLMACETARVGNDLIFSGLAPGLILAGVPAVVGMQYPVPDSFANSFANSFYAALLSQKDILEAFRTARQMNRSGAWYSPVLYLRHQAKKDEPVRAAYHTRKIDTAAPAEVQVGIPFLARLWIRRPETAPLTQVQLREELGVPETVPVGTREAEAEFKFEPVQLEPVTKRTLRRGEVDVELSSPGCDILPGSRKLFVDEHLDAPPAIFTVRARTVGRVPLLFSVWQDGGQIAGITQQIEVVGGDRQPRAAIESRSHTVPVRDGVTQISKTIGRYRILEEIGRGGMAVIYKGYHEPLNRHVAIKVLRTEFAQDEQFVARFRHEARAVAALSHSNILPVYDIGVDQGMCYIVMEFVDGGSLGDLITKGPMKIKRAISVAAQLGDALEHAHRHGLIHGDVKPNNVLISRDGRPFLTDFRIAKLLAESKGLDRTGATVGTPEYMAPEQILGQAEDARTDIYALGIVLYEMLAGSAPFAATNPLVTLYKHVNEPLPPLQQVNSRVPGDLEAVVNKALAKQQQERYQTAGEFANALRECHFRLSQQRMAAAQREMKEMRRQCEMGGYWFEQAKKVKQSQPEQAKSGTCSFIVVLLAIPRVVLLAWWLINPARFSLLAHGSWITVLLGIIFLPWVTAMYIVVFPGGVVGFDWLWLGLGLLFDVLSYVGVVRA